MFAGGKLVKVSARSDGIGGFVPQGNEAGMVMSGGLPLSAHDASWVPLFPSMTEPCVNTKKITPKGWANNAPIVISLDGISGMEEKRIHNIAIKYFEGEISFEEETGLFAFVKASKENDSLFRKWEEEWFEALDADRFS